MFVCNLKTGEGHTFLLDDRRVQDEAPDVHGLSHHPQTKFHNIAIDSIFAEAPVLR